MVMSDSYQNDIYAICISGIVSTFAGNGSRATVDGISASASFNNPFGITMNELTGDVYVSEYQGHVIRKISPHGIW